MEPQPIWTLAKCSVHSQPLNLDLRRNLFKSLKLCLFCRPMWFQCASPTSSLKRARTFGAGWNAQLTCLSTQQPTTKDTMSEHNRQMRMQENNCKSPYTLHALLHGAHWQWAQPLLTLCTGCCSGAVTASTQWMRALLPSCACCIQCMVS